MEQHLRQLLQAAESSGSDRQEAGTDNVKGQGTGKRWKKRQARTPIFSRDLVILPTEPRPSMLMNEENPKEEEEEVSPETTKSVALEQQLQAHFTEIASAGTAESEPEDDLSDTVCANQSRQQPISGPADLCNALLGLPVCSAVCIHETCKRWPDQGCKTALHSRVSADAGAAAAAAAA